MIKQFSEDWKKKYDDLRRKIEYDIYNFIIPKDIPYVNKKISQDDAYGWETIDLTDDCEIEISLWFQYKINSKKLLLEDIDLDVLGAVFNKTGDLSNISRSIEEFKNEFWTEFLDTVEKDYESIFWNYFLDDECSTPTQLIRSGETELTMLGNGKKFVLSPEVMGIEGILTTLISLYVSDKLT